MKVVSRFEFIRIHQSNAMRLAKRFSRPGELTALWSYTVLLYVVYYKLQLATRSPQDSLICRKFYCLLWLNFNYATENATSNRRSRRKFYNSDRENALITYCHWQVSTREELIEKFWKRRKLKCKHITSIYYLNYPNYLPVSHCASSSLLKTLERRASASEINYFWQVHRSLGSLGGHCVRSSNRKIRRKTRHNHFRVSTLQSLADC